jgi:hypothetical protein
LAVRPKGIPIDAPRGDVPRQPSTGATAQVTADALFARGADVNNSESPVPWSFRPLVEPATPELVDTDHAGSPIDRFVFARLEKEGLRPAAPADKRTLIRRVTYDLIGLPPTPAEIAEFLSDDSPASFARVVDRLVASPQYGERWARHWLDVVGFAETRGGESDAAYQGAFEYRDYVIRAFNDDLPFNQFLLEHLAGDLLNRPRRHHATQCIESIAATGIFCLINEHESPVDLDEEAANRADHQVELLSRAFLGIGIGCARCHDHKYDPITRDDYRRLAAHFRCSAAAEAFVGAPTEAVVGRLRAFDEENRLAVLDCVANELASRVKLLPPIWLSRAHRGGAEPSAKPAVALRWKSYLSNFAAHEPGNLFAPLWFAKSDVVERNVAMTREQAIDCVLRQRKLFEECKTRAQVYVDFSNGSFGEWSVVGDAFQGGPTTATVALLGCDAQYAVRGVVRPHVAHSGIVSMKLAGVLRSPQFIIRQPFIWCHASGQAARLVLIVEGLRDLQPPLYRGLVMELGGGGEWQWQTIDVSMLVGRRAWLEVIDLGDGFAQLDAVCFAPTPAPQEPASELAVTILRQPTPRSVEQVASTYERLFLNCIERWRASARGAAVLESDEAALINWLLTTDLLPRLKGVVTRLNGDHSVIDEFTRQRRSLEQELPSMHRVAALNAAPALDSHASVAAVGDQRYAGAEFLAPSSRRGTDRDALMPDRLLLARALTDPSIAPLVPRVIANRIWQHHFGTGIVASPSEFGNMGSAPTHPELLDFLARRLVESGWSLKSLHREIILSTSYQLSCDHRRDEQDRSRGTCLFANRRAIRLEGEAIRDAILAVCGQLDCVMYGPSVDSRDVGDGYGPEGPSTMDGSVSDAGARRSIYQTVSRNSPPRALTTFGLPPPSCLGAQRTSDFGAEQALVLLNDPLVHHCAHEWSRSLLSMGNPTPRALVQRVYLSALGREADAAELSLAIGFMEGQKAIYKDNPNEKAVADFCHVIFNTSEFIWLR